VGAGRADNRDLLPGGPGIPGDDGQAARSATAISALQVRYPDGRGILRQVLQTATERGFAIDDVSTETVGRRSPAGPAMVEVALHVHGRQSVNELAAVLSELDDVDVVLASDVHAIDE
jgi:acetolactate synthase regulatory subunit